MRRLAGVLILLVLIFITPSTRASTSIQDAVDWLRLEYPHSKVRQPLQIMEWIHTYATLNNVPFNMLVALIAIESGFTTTATSPVGAKGLTQVMPRYHREKIRNRDLNNPQVAIEVGSMILSDCKRRFGRWDRALRCYSGYSGRRAEQYVRAVLGEQRDFSIFQSSRKDLREQRLLLAMLTAPEAVD